jgi:hypothetical protein
MNYAQFLEAILRIACARSENAGVPFKEAYKANLEALFQNPNIEIKKRIEDDPILEFVYNPTNCGVFLDNEVILQAIFSEKSSIGGDNDFQLISKRDFYRILEDSNLLVLPKAKSKEEEKKAKDTKQAPPQQQQDGQAAAGAPTEQVTFAEPEVMSAIGPVGSFDADYLDYFNFLEAIVRVTLAKPWGPEEEDVSFDSKLEKVINSMDERFGESGENLVQRFMNVRKHTNSKEMY